MSAPDLTGETDASKWATAFAEARPDMVTLPGRDVAYDHGIMLSWFANAIEAGRDAGRKATENEWAQILSQIVFAILGPGDTLVMNFEAMPTARQADEIRARFAALCPNNKVIITCAESVTVERGEADGESPADH